MIDGVLDVMMGPKKRKLLWVGALACTLLAACADDDAATPPPLTPNVVQNNTYNNVTYQTTVIAAPVSDAEAPDSVVTDDPVSPMPTGSASQSPPEAGARRDLASTGIASCDTYLARVETCSRRILPKNDESDAAMHRITSSLDTTRRAWRAAAQTAASTSLSRTCADAMRTYNESISNYCPIENATR